MVWTAGLGAWVVVLGEGEGAVVGEVDDVAVGDTVAGTILLDDLLAADVGDVVITEELSAKKVPVKIMKNIIQTNSEKRLLFEND